MPENSGMVLIQATADADYKITTATASPDDWKGSEPPSTYLEVTCYTTCKTSDDCPMAEGDHRAQCASSSFIHVGAPTPPKICAAHADCNDGLSEGAKCTEGSLCGCGMECDGGTCERLAARSTDDF